MKSRSATIRANAEPESSNSPALQLHGKPSPLRTAHLQPSMPPFPPHSSRQRPSCQALTPAPAAALPHFVLAQSSPSKGENRTEQGCVLLRPSHQTSGEDGGEPRRVVAGLFGGREAICEIGRSLNEEVAPLRWVEVASEIYELRCTGEGKRVKASRYRKARRRTGGRAVRGDGAGRDWAVTVQSYPGDAAAVSSL